jgi:3-methylfumaryl-CoA hydratase
MWAGGRVRTSGPLRCGAPATRRSRVLSVQDKQGRSGPLTFVVAQHQVVQDGQVVVDEQQDIVYRPAVPPPGPATGPATGPAAGGPDSAGQADGPSEGGGAVVPPAVVPPAAGEWAIDVSPTLLFRFSALTYNAHRIHYDRDYVRDVEGYPGLLTHGPLQALAMAEAARAAGCDGDLALEYRLIAPLFDFQGLVVRASRAPDATTTAVRDIYGRRTATGTLTAGAGAGS